MSKETAKKVGFLGRMAGGKLQQGLDAIIAGLVKLDPETAGQAEMDQFEAQLNAASLELAQARQDYDREQKEATVARANYDKNLKAAEILQDRMDAATDEASRAGIGKSLDRLLESLEDLLPNVEIEEAEAIEAKQYLDELEVGVQEIAGMMKEIKRQIEAAKHAMKRAESAEERAKRNEDRAATLNGLRGGTKLGVALNAMSKATEASNLRADAANTRAKLFGGDKQEADTNIAAALAEAEGASSTALSRTERLAKLKGAKQEVAA